MLEQMVLALSILTYKHPDEGEGDGKPTHGEPKL